MLTHTIYTYSFDELSEAAQRRAWEREYYNYSEDYSSEYRGTLEAFEYIFDIKVYNWSVDEWNYTFDFKMGGRADDCPDGDPLRVARYIWNNYADAISKGKYYSVGRFTNGKYSYKARHSKITKEMDNCPLTGTYTDTDILQPVIDCLHYKQFFDNYEDLITTCLDSFFSSWKKAIEYTNSFEYFEEIATINEWQFLDNGTLWRVS